MKFSLLLELVDNLESAVNKHLVPYGTEVHRAKALLL